MSVPVEHGQWLSETKRIGELIVQISRVLIALHEKRTTLEEKMISRYLQDLLAGYGRVLEYVNTLLNDEKVHIGAELFGELSNLNSSVLSVIEELLKMIGYDLNFLEQYYEHAFLDRLIQDYRFKDNLARICQQLEAVCPGA